MSNNVSQELDKTMFGEQSVSNLNPVIQISANHGITDKVFTTSLGGTTRS